MCWEEGLLRFFDPVGESYLRSHEHEEDVGRVETAEVRAEEERTGRMAAETRAVTAESRVVELEAELRRLRGE